MAILKVAIAYGLELIMIRFSGAAEVGFNSSRSRRSSLMRFIAIGTLLVLGGLLAASEHPLASYQFADGQDVPLLIMKVSL